MNLFIFKEHTIPDDVAGWKWYKLVKETRFECVPTIKSSHIRYYDGSDLEKYVPYYMDGYIVQRSIVDVPDNILIVRDIPINYRLNDDVFTENYR